MGWNLDELPPKLRGQILSSLGEAQNAKLERPACDAALGPAQAQGRDPSRVLIRVTSIRKRLLDEDNIAVKYFVDCCRYAGIIREDNPGEAKIEAAQRKAEKGEEEATLAEIFW